MGACGPTSLVVVCPGATGGVQGRDINSVVTLRICEKSTSILRLVWVLGDDQTERNGSLHASMAALRYAFMVMMCSVVRNRF